MAQCVHQRRYAGCGRLAAARLEAPVQCWVAVLRCPLSCTKCCRPGKPPRPFPCIANLALLLASMIAEPIMCLEATGDDVRTGPEHACDWLGEAWTVLCVKPFSGRTSPLRAELCRANDARDDFAKVRLFTTWRRTFQRERHAVLP